MSHRLIFAYSRLLAWFTMIIAVGMPVRPAEAAAANGTTGPRSGQWAHETSSLRPDPNIVWGRLDNGLRYALLPHKGVPGRVSAQLIVLAGSLDETDEELGIAHYTEHMVFRRTKHFSFEEKLGFFQQLGMEFGSDVSAHTDWDSTVYSLDLHDVTSDLLFQSFRILRDFADGATFEPAEIDKERGVILSEMRDRTNLASSNRKESWPIVFKGLRHPQRSPIGTETTLRAMSRDLFVRFYERNYRPDLMVLVVTGEIETAKITSLIRERFGDMPKRATPVPARNEGRLDITRGLRGSVFPISDVGSAYAELTCITPPDGKPDSTEARAELFRRQIAMGIVSERVQAALGRGTAVYTPFFGQQMAVLGAPISADNWPRDLGVLDDLVRFTTQKGFEPRELEVIKRQSLQRTNYLLEQKDTLDPKTLSDGIAESILSHIVFTGWEADQRSVLRILNGLNPRELQLAFQRAWDLERMNFHLSGEIEIEGGATEVVKKVQEARKGGLRSFRPDTRKESVFELKRWGTPTAVAESIEVPELGAKLIRFDNNVRVNFVSNRSEAGVVNIIARIGTGLLEMPDNRPALKDFGLRTLLSSGSGNYPADFLAQIVEDHLDYFSFDLGDQDAFAFRVGGTTDQLDTCLGIVTDFLHRPLFNTTNHREVKMRAYLERSMTAFGQQEALRELGNHLFEGDPRLTWGGPGDYIGLSAIDVRNWLEEPLRHAYLEVTIVGDVSEEIMMHSVSRTLATLAPRSASKEMLSRPKPIKVTARPGFERIEFVGEQHLALVIGSWPVQASLTLRDRIALQIMSRILQDRVRLRLRSDLGLAYSPGASFEPYNGFGDFAIVRAFVQCNPDDSTKIAGLIDDIGAELAGNGITEGEFIGARHLLRGQSLASFREGTFLLNALKRAQEKPESVTDVLALKNGLVGEISLGEVNAWAVKVLPRKNSRTAAIVPKPFIGIFQTGQ